MKERSAPHRIVLCPSASLLSNCSLRTLHGTRSRLSLGQLSRSHTTGRNGACPMQQGRAKLFVVAGEGEGREGGGGAGVEYIGSESARPSAPSPDPSRSSPLIQAARASARQPCIASTSRSSRCFPGIARVSSDERSASTMLAGGGKSNETNEGGKPKDSIKIVDGRSRHRAANELLLHHRTDDERRAAISLISIRRWVCS